MGSRGAGSGRADAVLTKVNNSDPYTAARVQNIKAGDEIHNTYDANGDKTKDLWLYTTVNTRGAANAPVIITDVKATAKQVKITGKIDAANFQDLKNPNTKWGVNFIPVSRTFKPDEIVTTGKKKKK